MNQTKGGGGEWMHGHDKIQLEKGPQHHLKKDQIDVRTVQVPRCNQPAPNNNYKQTNKQKSHGHHILE